MKRCPLCGITKDFSEYHRSSKTSNGVQGHCKECKKVLSKKYEATRSKEKKSEYGKARWQKVRGDPVYLKKHKEWRDRNPERIKETLAIYRKKNRVQLLAHRSNQKCRNKGYPGILSVKEWEAALQLTKYLCIACEEVFADSVDHVIPLINGGHNAYDNIQPMCLRCNLKKGRRHVDFRPEGFSESIKEICSR